MNYRVTAYMNTDPENYAGYSRRHALANSGETYNIQAGSPESAAERMFAVGNRVEADAEGAKWPSDIRSISVGDVLAIREADSKQYVFYAVDSIGWQAIDLPDNPTTALAGHPRVTRRV